MKVIALVVALLMVTGIAFAQVTEKVDPIDKDNIRMTRTNIFVIPKEDLLREKEMLEGDIARAQQELAKIEALLAQYK